MSVLKIEKDSFTIAMIDMDEELERIILDEIFITVNAIKRMHEALCDREERRGNRDKER